MSTTNRLQHDEAPSFVTQLDALVIGAGWGGMYALYLLRKKGYRVLGIEAGGNVGGTWYWNRYPGARCDVMSIDYSYSFSDEIQQEWVWSEQFAAQPEILAYGNFVADKLDLRRDIRFNTRATSIIYDDSRRLWVIETACGDRYEVTWCIMATGPLSVPKGLDIPGTQNFAGEVYLAARWPQTRVDLAGKRVGVIGTGSTGIQIVPVVAKQCDMLHVFQRTPSFSLPMRNRPLDPDYVADIKAHYPALRQIARNTPIGGVRAASSRPFFSIPAAEREALMEEAWNSSGLAFLGLFSDLLTNCAANDIVADFVRAKIDTVVKDTNTAERLKPRGYPVFARRPCLDTDYYETFNRPNVILEDCLTNPIVGITERGIQTETRAIDLDVIIAATGYDALTGAMLAIDIKGRGGRSLKEKWSGGARSYLGLAMEGFPNLFLVAGSNGPSILANHFLIHEQNVEWIGDCIDYMCHNRLATIEATAQAEQKWMDNLSQLAETTLYPKANTWYVGANIPGKPRVFSVYVGGLNRYSEKCTDVAARCYEGFAFESVSA